MTIKSQMKQLTSASEINHNKFINMLASGIIDAVSKINPDLILTPMARNSQKSSIYLTLNGRATVSDDRTKEDINEYMNKIKNDVELMKALRE